MIETCAMSERTNTGHFFAYSPPSSMTWLMQPSLFCHGFSTLICACKFASLFSSLSIVPPWACSLSLPYAEAVLYTRYLPTSSNQIPAMPQGIAPEYNSDEIDFTNRELVSLFIQYPDMPDMPDGDDESTPTADFGEDGDTSTFQI